MGEVRLHGMEAVLRGSELRGISMADGTVWDIGVGDDMEARGQSVWHKVCRAL